MLPSPKKTTASKTSTRPVTVATPAGATPGASPADAATLPRHRAPRRRKSGPSAAPAAAQSKAPESKQQQQRGADAVSAISESEFNNMLADIMENPEKLHDASLYSDEQILEIQKRLNPYGGVAGPPRAPDQKKVAAVSYTNLREDYLRRLTMTSLVGFVFQMLTEWEVPAEARRWTPAKKRADDPAHQPYEADALVAHLEATLAVAKAASAAAGEARGAEAAAAEATRQASETALLFPDKEAESTAAAAEKNRLGELAAGKAAGLLYAASHAAHRLGAEASGRLRSTADLCLRFPEVKSVIAQYPLPPPPGQVEVPASVAKEIIGGFLRHWFVFDPSVHVRSASNADAIKSAVASALVASGESRPVDAADPSHLTLEAVLAAAVSPEPGHREALRVIKSSQHSLDAVSRLLRDEDLADAALAALAAPEAFRHYLFPVAAGDAARPAAENVPPQDTFHRWNYFTEVNYEALRTITEALYPERSDLDWAIALWQTFEGTAKEVDTAFDKFCQRYQDEVPSSIKTLEFGSWSLLADFKENRKKVQFYNKHTEVLKRILDRHAEDKRIGAELMRNRVLQEKARNIREAGPDGPGLKEYRRNQARQGQDLGAQGVERVISPEEMKRLEKARGDVKAAKELELLEQTERRIEELKELKTLREKAGESLSGEEQAEYERHLREIDRIHEMLAVPDDAIQVDVFTNDGGNMARSHFYTKAEAPEHLARDPAAAAGTAAHPAVAASAAAAALASAAAPAAAPSPDALPAYAPYAVEHILAADRRTPAAQRLEALQDAERR